MCRMALKHGISNDMLAHDSQNRYTHHVVTWGKAFDTYVFTHHVTIMERFKTNNLEEGSHKAQ